MVLEIIKQKIKLLFLYYINHKIDCAVIFFVFKVNTKKKV